MRLKKQQVSYGEKPFVPDEPGLISLIIYSIIFMYLKAYQQRLKWLKKRDVSFK